MRTKLGLLHQFRVPHRSAAAIAISGLSTSLLLTGCGGKSSPELPEAHGSTLSRAESVSPTSTVSPEDDQTGDVGIFETDKVVCNNVEFVNVNSNPRTIRFTPEITHDGGYQPDIRIMVGIRESSDNSIPARQVIADKGAASITVHLTKEELLGQKDTDGGFIGIFLFDFAGSDPPAPARASELEQPVDENYKGATYVPCNVSFRTEYGVLHPY